MNCIFLARLDVLFGSLASLFTASSTILTFNIAMLEKLRRFSLSTWEVYIVFTFRSGRPACSGRISRFTYSSHNSIPGLERDLE